MRRMNTNASALLLRFLNERPRMDDRLRPLLTRLARNSATPRDTLADPGTGTGSDSDGKNKNKVKVSLSKQARGGDMSQERGPVLLLAVNGGVLDLVLNFLCSAQRHGIGGHGHGGDIFLR